MSCHQMEPRFFATRFITTRFLANRSLYPHVYRDSIQPKSLAWIRQQCTFFSWWIIWKYFWPSRDWMYRTHSSWVEKNNFLFRCSCIVLRLSQVGVPTPYCIYILANMLRYHYLYFKTKWRRRQQFWKLAICSKFNDQGIFHENEIPGWKSRRVHT